HVENNEEPRITRGEFDPNEGFVEGPSISFATLGFSATGLTHEISANKAYNVSYADLKVAIFDPTEMVLLQPTALDLSAHLKEGFAVNELKIEQRGNHVFIAVAFANLGTFSIADNLTVLIVDATTDSYVATIEDTRCHHASGMVQTEAGDLYVLGDNGYNVLN